MFSQISKTWLFLAAILLLVGCGSKEKRNKPASTDNYPETAVCVVDSAPVFQDLSATQTKTFVHMGEFVKLQTDSQPDPTHPGSFFYHIILDDGTSCFVRSSFVLPGGKVAAVIDSTKIFSRDDTAAITESIFPSMERVIASPEGAKFTEIRVSQSKKTGWIQNGHLAYNITDVQVATAIASAMAETDPQKRVDSLQAIINNPEYDKSVFLAKIPAHMINPSPSDVQTDSAQVADSAGTNMAE